MSVGYLVPEFPSQTHAFFWREVRGLRAAGAEVVLLSTRRPEAGSCKHRFAEEAAGQTHYLHPPSWFEAVWRLLSRPRHTLRALAYLNGLAETPLRDRARLCGLLLSAAELCRLSEELGLTHVHVHSCANAAHLVALAERLGGPSYSLTLHGDLVVYGKDHARKMEKAAFVSTVTRPLQTELCRTIGLSEERVPLIWMGVDTESFRPPAQRSFEQGRLHLVTIARLNPTKGHVHALRAMRGALAAGLDLEYTIAGDGPHREPIEAAVRELGLGDRVHFPGTISEEEVRELLDAADAFVLPSIGLGEAAPVSVMEAMASGLPVISSIIGGTRDMIADRVDGLLVECGDEAGIERALRELAGDLELRRELGRAARERALQTFDYRTMAGKLYEAIRTRAAA